MAGDWIKMTKGLRTHPKIVRIARVSKSDKLRVIGALHVVWCLFDEHSEDGFLDGYTLEAIDEETFKGFGKALVAVDWLVENAEGLTVPRFDTHNGVSAKRRAQETERKRIEREQTEDETRTESGQLSASDADEKRSREEKRRKDKETPPPKAAAVGLETLVSDGLETEVAVEWLAHRRAKKALLTPRAWDLVKSESLKAGWPLQDAVCRAMAKGWVGFEADWVAKDAKPAASGTPGWAQ